MSHIPLTQPQREAIFELLLLGMYADSTLRMSENERIYELASSLGWEGPRDPREYAQLGTARARAAAENDAATATYLQALNTRIGTDEAKTHALALLGRVLNADNADDAGELELYQKARAAFGV